MVPGMPTKIVPKSAPKSVPRSAPKSAPIIQISKNKWSNLAFQNLIILVYILACFLQFASKLEKSSFLDLIFFGAGSVGARSWRAFGRTFGHAFGRAFRARFWAPRSIVDATQWCQNETTMELVALKWIDLESRRIPKSILPSPLKGNRWRQQDPKQEQRKPHLYIRGCVFQYGIQKNEIDK